MLPEITQPTSDALVKVLAKNPADRYLSYDEFRMALEAARSQLLVQRYTQNAAGQGRQKQDELVAAVSRRFQAAQAPERLTSVLSSSRRPFASGFVPPNSTDCAAIFPSSVGFT